MNNPKYDKTVKLAQELADHCIDGPEVIQGEREQLARDIVTFIEAWEPEFSDKFNS